MHETTLWYEQPAADGNAALPVGNGRLGAMVSGGIEVERLPLNFAQPDAHPALAELWMEQDLGGTARNYRRALDLDAAVATTGFTVKGTRFTREVFASAPDSVLIIRLHTSTPESLNLTVRLTRGEAGEGGQEEVKATGRAGLALRGPWGRDGGHVACFVQAQVEGGTLRTSGDTIQIHEATLVTLFVAAATNGQGRDPEEALQTLEAALLRPYPELLARHQAEHRRLFRRVQLELPSSSKLPTDQRLAANPDEPGLAALTFHYGRYLLIASSRPGSPPANVPGLMPARAAEVTNLPECLEPLFDSIEHSAMPESEPLEAARLCQPLFEHWRFAPEKLKHLRRIYPVLKRTSERLLDFVVKEPDDAALDRQIIRECWENTLTTAQLLGTDDALQSKLERALEKLALLEISPEEERNGQDGETVHQHLHAIAECLLQSHAGEIHLLPALPLAWPQGSVTGLRARGGVTVEAMRWEGGNLTHATLVASHTLKVPVRVQGSAETRRITLPAGRAVTLGAGN